MKINSKYFSLLEYEENSIIYFKDGLFGFEDYKYYIIIQFDENNDNLYCIQSIDSEDLAFVLIKSVNFIPDYPKSVASYIKNDDITDTSTVYNICVIRDVMSDSTANLKCPILINLDKNEGRQVILENDTFSMKFPFSNLTQQKEV